MTTTRVFIDSRIKDMNLLIAQFAPGTEYSVLDASFDGVAQIVAALAVQSGYDSIQIISHGSPSSVMLGSTSLSLATMNDYAVQLAQISSSLTSTGDILLYGCNVGDGEDGLAFIDELAQLTGADVAASDDLTGNAALGGNWELEVQSGMVESVVQPLVGLEGVLANSAPTLSVPTSAVVFASTIDYITGSAAQTVTQNGYASQAIVAADINGDNEIDLVITNSNSATVSVLMNDGNGSFAPKVDYSVGSGPHSVTVTDINNDALPDLVVANNWTEPKISVLLNNGNGIFASQVNYPAGADLYAVTSADINKDGWMDIIATNSSAGTITVLQNNGDGTFPTTNPASYSTGTSPLAIASADFNNDGFIDLVVPNSGNSKVSVLLNNGSGGFTDKTDYNTGADTTAIRPVAVIATDINSDNNADIVIANFTSGNVSVLLNNGDGTFATISSTPSFPAYPTGNNPASISATDCNGDGKTDLVVANSGSDSVSVLLNNGDGTFATTPLSYQSGIQPYAVTTADINSDNKNDIIVTNNEFGQNRVSVLVNTSSVEATSFTEKTPVAVCNNIVLTDSDGDASWNGGSLKVQITGNAETTDTLSLPAVNPNKNGIWLDTSAGNIIMAGTTVIGAADAPSVTSNSKWILTFNDNATNALVQDVARSVMFNNSSDTPSELERVVTFMATDNLGAATSLEQRIAVTAVDEPADNIAPTLTTSTPLDNATAIAVNSNIVLTFSEAVQAGTGNITISNGVDNPLIISVTDSQVTISNNTVTINPATDLRAGSNYHVEIASTAISDLAGNAYAGISDATTLDFGTNSAPTISSSAVTYDYAWTRNLLSGWDNGGYGITFDAASKNTIIVGAFTHSINFHPDGGSDTHSSTAFRDAYIWKMDANHTYNSGGWSVTRSAGNVNDSYNDVVTDSAGNIYVSGNFDTGSYPSAWGPRQAVAKYSPTGTLLWSYEFGTFNNYASAASLALADDGAIYVAGTFQGTVTLNATTPVTLTSQGGQDGFLYKLNSDGTLDWVKTIGGTGNDYFNAVVVKGSEVYTAGHFENTVSVSASQTATAINGTDGLVVHYDNNGAYQWSQTFVSPTGNTYINKTLDVTADGQVVVGGNFQGTLSTGIGSAATTVSSVGGFDAFVSTLNADGSVNWLKSYGGTADDGLNSIKVGSNGSLNAAGSISGEVDIDPGANTKLISTAGTQDGYVLTLDAQGNYVSHQLIGSASGQVSINEIAFDPSNNDMYVTGGFNGTVDFNTGDGVYNVSDPAVDWSMFVSKYTALQGTGAGVFAGSVTELADTDVDENSTNHEVSGSFAISDVDLTDTQSVVAVPAGTDYLGTFTPTFTDQTTTDGTGTIDWNFTVADSSLDYLAAGETRTQSYTVTVTDSAGATATKDVVITINGTNDAPTSTNSSITTDEDTAKLLSLEDFGAYTDPEETALAKVQITTLESAGTLQYHDGTSWTDVALNQEITAADITAGKLRFEPMANANGSAYATLSYKVSDGLAYSENNYTLIVNVSAVNDAPEIGTGIFEGSMTELANTDVDENSTNHEVSGSFAISDVDLTDTQSVAAVAAGTDYLGTFTPTVTDQTTTDVTGTVGWNFTVADSVLDYLAAGQTRTQTYTVTVTDSAGATATKDVVITINGTNDAPTSTNGSITTDEDTAKLLSLEDFGTYTDPEGTALAKVQITTLESAGALQYHDGTSWTDVALNQEITAADINDGKLRFEPVANANGSAYATLSYKVSDGEFYSVNDYTLTVNVSAVNDAPEIGTGIFAGSVTELADTDVDENSTNHEVSGSFAISDVDLTDTQSVAAVAAGTDYLGTFTSTVTDQTTTDGVGTIGWNFTVTDSALDYLAAGQTQTQTYTVTVMDTAGATVTKDVVITINGTNDTPDVDTTDVTGAITEMVTPVSNLTDSGTIGFTDVDLTNSHSISSVTPSAGALGTLISTITTDTTGTGVGGVVTWSYSVDASAIEYLAEDEHKVETFTFNILDDNGGSFECSVNVTITGTYDDTIAPTLTASTPFDNATTVAIDSNITFIFSENLQAGTGNIVISNDTDIRTIAVTDSSQVTFDGDTIIINPTDDLHSGSSYHVEIASGVVEDLVGNAYVGMGGAETLDFETINALSGHITFWKTGEAITNVTTTLTTLPTDGAQHAIELKNIHVKADGSHIVEVWATTPNSTTGSFECEFVLPTGANATWQDAAKLPAKWISTSNTIASGNFLVDGMSTNPLAEGAVKLGTLTITQPTNPDTFELAMVHAQLGDDDVTGYAVSSVSSSSGSSTEYRYQSLTDGHYALTGDKAAGDAESAVHANDALAALKMAVELNPNDDGSAVLPYQYLAADINRDGKVRANDALNILKMAVGIESAPEDEWIFVSEEVAGKTMDRTHVDWSDLAPTIDFNQTSVDLDLIGIVKGDVDGSWLA